jgi:hypothetical protein
LPERVPASVASAAASGRSLPASLASYDPATSSWRTSQLCLDGEAQRFSETLPRSGLMRSGKLYPQPTLVLPTAASASGLLPTPVAKDDGKSFEGHMAMKARMGRNTCSSLAVMARSGMWPTPHGFSQDGRSNGPSGNELGRAVNRAMWQTPVADDAVDRRAGKWNSRGEPKLSAQVMWPTPRSEGHDAGRTDPTRSLYAAVRATWPTPTIDGNYNRKGASAASGDGLATAVGGSLNPDWVEKLMGLPQGWTDLGDRDGKTVPPG